MLIPPYKEIKNNDKITTNKKEANRMIEIFSSVLSMLMTFFPFALLYFLLNLVEKHSNQPFYKYLGIFLYIFIILGYIVLILLGLLLHASAAFISNNAIFEQLMKDIFSTSNLSITPDLLHRLGFSIWIPSIIALILFIPIVRKGIARLIPIQPFNRIHTITLVLSILIIIQLTSTFAIGLELLSSIEANTNVWSLIAQLWSQDIMFFVIACLGVGFLTRRNLKETFARLGLEKLTWKQFIFGCLIAIGLVITAYLLEVLFASTPFGTDENVQEYTNKLIGPLFKTIPGILTLGLAAAIGEEALFRGAMQPRFGLLLTSLLFALVHSNYGLSLSTAIVFGVGLVLGIIRIRYSTTLAMLIHATYNICLGFISYLFS